MGAAVNLLDLVILLVLAVSLFSGFRRGAALQLVTYTGLIAGLIAGAILAPQAAGLAEDPFTQATIALATLVGLAAIGDALGWVLGRKVWVAARRSQLSPVDQAAGTVVAAVAVLLTVWFLAFNLVQGPFPSVSRQIRDSAVVRALDTALPRPPSLLAQVRGFLGRFGFPEVFAGLPPAPAGPVKEPSDAEARRAFQAAEEATLKVVGQACDRVQEGTGFLVEPHYVVTNAHVVAGVSQPQVQQQDGAAFDADTVLFDDDLDLAVLRVEAGPTADLDLGPGSVDRGTPGAVVGYPRGGPLTGEKAAVRRELMAVGKDIYGRDTVERRVYELQAEVVPGNSGGPFVTEDGSVAGVVFAASTTHAGVGYALTAQEAGPPIQQALGRTQPVNTGPCLR
jgi:S1-C subfamily serine protease